MYVSNPVPLEGRTGRLILRMGCVKRIEPVVTVNGLLPYIVLFRHLRMIDGLGVVLAKNGGVPLLLLVHPILLPEQACYTTAHLFLGGLSYLLLPDLN